MGSEHSRRELGSHGLRWELQGRACGPTENGGQSMCMGIWGCRGGSELTQGLTCCLARSQNGGVGPAPRRPPGVLWTAAGHVRPDQLPAG